MDRPCQFQSMHGNGCPFQCLTCGMVTQTDRLDQFCLKEDQAQAQAAQDSPCAKRGEEIRLQKCPTCCGGSVKIKVFACSEFGECSIAKKLDGVACCAGCSAYTPTPQE
jgi:hypothetical protein